MMKLKFLKSNTAMRIIQISRSTKLAENNEQI